jgi:hypothetical protein
MLQTLRKYDPKEAQRILSSLTTELLPDPEVGNRGADFTIDPVLHSDVWKEIRRRVKVDPTDTSPETRGRVFEFLFTEMSQIALPNSELDSVKAKLSFRGELRPDLYDVRFVPKFRTAEAHGIRRNHVLEAIRNADDVEHLNLLDGEELLSLFLRTHKDFPSRDPFVLLVLADRVGARLEVFDAFRAYLSDIDLSAAQRPSDILRLIVEKYGLNITIGHITSKLILNQTVTIEGRLDPKTFAKVHAHEGSSVLAAAVWRKRALLNSYGIGLAFALDQTKYAADLRKHGVNVKGGPYRFPKFE